MTELAPGTGSTTGVDASPLKGWGTSFADQMVLARYDADHGWGELELLGYSSLQFAPSLAVFHYCQVDSRDLKVYGQPGGGAGAFRPEQNARRFASSARRLAMAELPEELFRSPFGCSSRLIVIWFQPRYGEKSYLRPLEIATDERLQVHPSKKYLYILMASPVADYFPNGIRPIRVWINTDYARAMPGGTGGTKCAGNYAAAMLAQQHGVENRCDQVVWLDSVENKVCRGDGRDELLFRDR